jgi:transposase
MTYPIKYRQKVFAIKAKKGLTFEETGEHFEIPIRTLFRWSKRLEPYEKHRYHKSKIDKEKLLEDVNVYPDAYQKERALRLGVSESCVCITLKKLKISYKKNTKAPKGK